MVYQGFKVLKRNPTFYNPRSAGMVALAYIAYSFYLNKYIKPSFANLVIRKDRLQINTAAY